MPIGVEGQRTVIHESFRFTYFKSIFINNVLRNIQERLDEFGWLFEINLNRSSHDKNHKLDL